MSLRTNETSCRDESKDSFGTRFVFGATDAAKGQGKVEFPLPTHDGANIEHDWKLDALRFDFRA